MSSKDSADENKENEEANDDGKSEANSDDY